MMVSALSSDFVVKNDVGVKDENCIQKSPKNDVSSGLLFGGEGGI
jgi:hypothetical protein